jgi:hypothetical protein
MRLCSAGVYRLDRPDHIKSVFQSDVLGVHNQKSDRQTGFLIRLARHRCLYRRDRDAG